MARRHRSGGPRPEGLTRPRRSRVCRVAAGPQAGGEKIVKPVRERSGGGRKIVKPVHERSGGEEEIAESLGERSEDGEKRGEPRPDRSDGGEKIGESVRGWFQAARNSESVPAAGFRRRETRDLRPRLDRGGGESEEPIRDRVLPWSSTAAFP